MGEKGLAVLRNHIRVFGKETVAYVVTARDEGVLRDFCEEIHALCKKNGVTVLDRKQTPAAKAAYALAVSWRWIIPRRNLVVFHDSLLPAYRGFSPLVNMLIDGEKKIGVSALLASDDYDAGPVIAQKAVPVSYPLKIAKAIKMITPLYCSLAEKIAGNILSGKPVSGKSQDESRATYSLWRDEEDYRIDWSRNAEEIKRFIDAVGFPYKGALARTNRGTFRILEARPVADVRIVNRDAGKVIFVRNGKPVVVCGRGLLCITRMITQEGGNALPLKQFRTRFY